VSLQSLFSQANFRRTIESYTAQNGWTLDDINDTRAKLRFRMQSGRIQSLFIYRFENTLEFSVPSAAIFDSEAAIPDVISTKLLLRNSQQKVGFWCIEKIQGSYVYSCMHNAEMQLIDAAFFAIIVRSLIKECDDFEGLF